MTITIANANAAVNSSREFHICYTAPRITGMEEWPERERRVSVLRREVDAAGGPAAFARAHPGVDPTYVSQLLNGFRSFGERAARAMEERVGWTRGFLDAPSTDVNVVPARAPRARVPVISWVAAGAWDDANDPYAPGAAARWEEIDEELGRQVFALEVRGDSMENPVGRDSFPEGCLIVVDPSRKPVPGDFVVVRNDDWDEATFKQYIVDAGIKLLRPLNSQYPTLQVKSGTRMVGVVVMKIEKKRY